MAKLPNAGDLTGQTFRPARSFTNVPIADYQGAFSALGRGLTDVGEGAQRYAAEADRRLKDEEAFGVNLRLADAQVQFSNAVTGLDPSDPEFASKRMKAWSDTFKPIVDGIQHGENKRRFGEWAYENGAKVQIESDQLSLAANTQKTKLQLLDYIEKQKKLVADNVISPEVASANIKAQAAQAPYLFENDKQEFLLRDAVKFDADAVELVGASLIGNARKAPDSWAAYEGRLGLFLDAMSQAGYPLQISSHYRTPEYQAKLYRQKVEELRRQGVANPEAAARKWVAAPGENAPHYNGASDLAFNGTRLGDKGTEAATKKAHELAAQFGLNFRMDHEPWHIEPVKDGSAPPVVARRGQSEVAILSIVEANPVFRNLPPDQQNTIRDNLRIKYRQQMDEQEKLDIVAGTRAAVDYAAANYLDVDDAREYLRTTIKDPLALEDGLTMLDQEFDRERKLEEQRKIDTFKATAARVLELRDAGKTDEALATVKSIEDDKIDPDDREKLRELALNGRATLDNADVEAKLWALAYKEPDKFKDTDLTFYQGQLTQETIEKFEKRQADLKDPKKSDLTAVRTVGAILDNYYGELGLRDGKDAPEQDLRFRRLIDTQVGRQLSAFETTAGRPATPDEVQDIVDTTFMTFSTPGKVYGTNTNTITTVLSEMEKQEGSSGLPLGTLYGAAINDLTKNGYEPTPENLNRWLGDYRNRQQAKKANAQ